VSGSILKRGRTLQSFSWIPDRLGWGPILCKNSHRATWGGSRSALETSGEQLARNTATATAIDRPRPVARARDRGRGRRRRGRQIKSSPATVAGREGADLDGKDCIFVQRRQHWQRILWVICSRAQVRWSIHPGGNYWASVTGASTTTADSSG